MSDADFGVGEDKLPILAEEDGRIVVISDPSTSHEPAEEVHDDENDEFIVVDEC